ncbi:DUF5711 family protein [Evtepia sp.]|uniref:DUF5711 family protein n=1 Tax=Evtepia sp. TaxID=2773933 RepID=UPI003F14F911
MSKLQTLKTSLTRRQRVILLIIAAVILFGLLAVTVFRDNATTALRRLTYAEGKDDFSHNAQFNSLFLGVDDNLLVCTQTQIQVFSPTGTVDLKESVNMTSPALNTAGEYTVVYDVGGQQLKVIQGEKLVNKLELPAEESLICATVNDKGWVAVTSKVSGYKAVVTVYNPSFESVLAIRLSSRYISDAVVTPDCRGVYLISPGQAGGAFENTLLYYTFSSREEPTKTLSLGSNVVLSILSSGKCWILGDQSLLILDSSGVITARYDYEGQYLKMGSLQGDDFAALLLSRSSSGSAGTLVTVDDNGKEYGRLTLEGQTSALAAQGHDVAVLTTGEIITSDRKLNKYRSEPNQRGIRNIALYEDGSVALVSSATVSLYFPSGPKIVNEEAES